MSSSASKTTASAKKTKAASDKASSDKAATAKPAKKVMTDEQKAQAKENREKTVWHKYGKDVSAADHTKMVAKTRALIIQLIGKGGLTPLEVEEALKDRVPNAFYHPLTCSDLVLSHFIINTINSHNNAAKRSSDGKKKKEASGDDHDDDADEAAASSGDDVHVKDSDESSKKKQKADKAAAASATAEVAAAPKKGRSKAVVN